MRIQHNITAMNAYRNYNTNNSSLGKNLEKLSSGYKINRAGDDAAGLAISEKMRAQITGLSVAQKNAKDGISVVQTAEGALTEVHDMLNRMYELAEQAANGTYGDTERGKLQSEVSQLQTEITRISDATNFNGKKLLDGSLSDTETVSAKFNATRIYVTSDNKLETLPAKQQYVAAVDLTNIGKSNADAGNSTMANFGTSTNYQTASLKQNVSGGSFTLTFKIGNGNLFTSDSQTEALASGSTLELFEFDASNEKTGNSVTITLNKDIAISESPLQFSEANKRLVVGTIWDGKALGQASNDKAMNLQIGDTAATYNQMKVDIKSMSADALGVGGLDISSYEGSIQAMNAVMSAIDLVSTQRSTLGAIQNRLDHTINNLSTMQENIQDAESTIRDTDVAEEMMEYTKNSILVQSAQSMLAQANTLPQSVLSLLQ